MNVNPAPGTVTTGSTASANGLGILNAYPAPNLTTRLQQQLVRVCPTPAKATQRHIAVDVNLTEKQPFVSAAFISLS